MSKKRIPIPTEQDVIDEITDFSNAIGIQPTTFTMMAIGQANIIERLHKGRSITLDLIRRMREFGDYELARRQAKKVA